MVAETRELLLASAPLPVTVAIRAASSRAIEIRPSKLAASGPTFTDRRPLYSSVLISSVIEAPGRQLATSWMSDRPPQVSSGEKRVSKDFFSSMLVLDVSSVGRAGLGVGTWI